MSLTPIWAASPAPVHIQRVRSVMHTSCHFLLLGVCVDRNHVGSRRWLRTSHQCAGMWANTSNCHNWYSQTQLGFIRRLTQGLCTYCVLSTHLIEGLFGQYFGIFWQINTKLAKYRQKKLAGLMRAKYLWKRMKGLSQNILLNSCTVPVEESTA